MKFAGYPASGALVARALAAVALAFAALAAQAQSQSGTDCDCADANDLFSRYCAAQGAVREWDRLIRQVRSEESKQGKVISALSTKDDLALCVDEVISVIRHDKGNVPARTARGSTDRNCNVTVDAPTACLRGVIEYHESWHKKMCDAHNQPDAPWRDTGNPFSYLGALINRMSAQSAIDYMYEERTGYMLEVQYTRNRLEELAGRCKSDAFVPAPSGRSFTLRRCPRPDMRDFERKCTRP